jgi:hypothetical protein
VAAVGTAAVADRWWLCEVRRNPSIHLSKLRFPHLFRLHAAVCSPAPQLAAPAAAPPVSATRPPRPRLFASCCCSHSVAITGWHGGAPLPLGFGRRLTAPDAAWHRDLPCFAFHHVEFCFIRADSCRFC